MRKKIDNFIKSDFKLGQYVITNRGTGFIIGFSENLDRYYLYLVDSTEGINLKDDLLKLEGYTENFIEYLGKQGNLVLKNVLNPKLVESFRTSEHKKYVDLRINGDIVKKWRTKSQLVNGDTTVYRDAREERRKYKVNKVYEIENGERVVYVGYHKFVSIELLEERKRLGVEPYNDLKRRMEQSLRRSYYYNDTDLYKLEKNRTVIKETNEEYRI